MFHPWQVWWFFGDMDLPLPGPHARIARSAPAWLSPIPHPLIVVVALPLSLLAARRKADPLALLALLLLPALRPRPVEQRRTTSLPCVLALVAWEPLRYGRPPLLALATVVATFISMERIFDVAPPTCVALSYLVWALPLAVPRLAVYAPRSPRPDAQLRRSRERLEHDAVALGEADERGEVLLAGVRVEVEAQADRAEAHGRVAVDTERAAEVEVALGVDAGRLCTSTPIDVATARSVTPAQAASASSSMSPEHSWEPSPPLAGWRPASASARPVSTEQQMPSPRLPLAFRVTTAASGSSR